MKRLLLSLFLRSADDLIAFLDHVEQKLRKLADQALEEAGRLDVESGKLRSNAAKALAVADKVKA